MHGRSCRRGLCSLGDSRVDSTRARNGYEIRWRSRGLLANPQSRSSGPAAMTLAVEAPRTSTDNMKTRDVAQTRRVLFVAYHFPPDGAVGGTRPAKMARYLSQLGWDVHVVTVREDEIPRKDHSRLGDLDGLTVHRTAVWPTVLEVGLRIRNAVRAALGWQRRPPVTERTEGEPPVTASKTGVSATLMRWLDSLFELPDKEVGWLAPAILAGLRVIRRHNVEVVVTSS